MLIKYVEKLMIFLNRSDIIFRTLYEREELKLNNQYNEMLEEDFQIDLIAFLKKLKSMWYYVLMGCIVGVLITSIYTAFFTTPIYSSSSNIYFRDTGKTASLSDLQLGSQLAKDYGIIIKSRPNMDKVIEKLDLPYTASQLSNMIKVVHEEDTRFLKVSIATQDPYLSKDIVNEVVVIGIESIKIIDDQEPYVVEKAIANGTPVNTSIVTMAQLGALGGGAVTIAIIFLMFLFNDKITTIDDAERALNLPVLCVVKENKKLSYVKKVSKKTRKAKR